MSFHKDVPWGGGESTMDSSCLAVPMGHTTVLTARLVVSVTQRLKLLSSG